MSTSTTAFRQQALAGHVDVGEAFGHDGRGGGDNQRNGEHDLLHGGISDLGLINAGSGRRSGSLRP